MMNVFSLVFVFITDQLHLWKFVGREKITPQNSSKKKKKKKKGNYSRAQKTLGIGDCSHAEFMVLLLVTNLLFYFLVRNTHFACRGNG